MSSAETSVPTISVGDSTSPWRRAACWSIGSATPASVTPASETDHVQAMSELTASRSPACRSWRVKIDIAAIETAPKPGARSSSTRSRLPTT